MFFKVKIIRKYCKLYLKMFYDAFQHQKHLDRIKNPNENTATTKTTEPVGFFISKEQMRIKSTGIIRSVVQPHVPSSEENLKNFPPKISLRKSSERLVSLDTNHSFILEDILEEEKKRLEFINVDQNPPTKKKIKKKVKKDRTIKSTSHNLLDFSHESHISEENVVFPPTQNIDLPIYEPIGQINEVIHSNVNFEMNCPLTIEQLNLSNATNLKETENRSINSSKGDINKATMGTETHNYDGYLPKTSLLNSKLNSLVKSTSNIDRKNSVINLCNEISNARSSSINPISISFFQTLINDWGTNNNFDSSNNLCADDLLYVLAIEWNNIKECNDKETIVSFVDELCIQFADMQTGICSEGRTTRLWQIALTYIEWCVDKEVNEDSLAFDLI